MIRLFFNFAKFSSDSLTLPVRADISSSAVWLGATEGGGKAVIHAMEEQMGGHLFYFPGGSSHAKCLRDSVVESYRAMLTHAS